MDSGPRAMAGMTQFIDEVTAHEVSHQWWGHMVGWSTYHDQWLSEGFADFSAGLYLQLTEKTPDKYLKYWEHARQAIVEKNSYGRRANDAGPIWLGRRLSTEKNGGAYRRVIYDKGGFVLHMLRQMMFDARNGGDRQFIAMMQEFVQQHMNRNATTERFQRVVEKHMTPAMNVTGDGKMDWFFGEWVYGTMLPKYKLDYTLTAQDDGKVQLKGTISQSEVPQGFIMLVPIYMDFEGTVTRLGSARMAGSATMPLDVVLPKKPRRVMLNYYHDVLEQ
jgi:aminopeptidase N